MKEQQTKEKLLRDEFSHDFFDAFFFDLLTKSQKEAIYRAMERYAKNVEKELVTSEMIGHEN